jgi:hypothetical protein
MPKLSCWSCGRQIYTVAPLEALFPEERRCPRCGAFLNKDRRETERRLAHRRVNPPHDPGPPTPKPKAAAKPKTATKPAAKAKGRPTKAAADAEPALPPGERRVTIRRASQRRGTGRTPPSTTGDGRPA